MALDKALAETLKQLHQDKDDA